MRKLLYLLGILALSMPLLAQTAVPIINPHVTFVDTSGAACAGCSLYTYTAGTTTPLVTYTDASEVGQNTNPIILDASGGASIWFGANSYKLVLKDTGGTTIWSADQITSLSGQYLSKAATGSQTMAGPLVTPQINGIANVQTYSGATADIQINACLAAHDVCDARGYGATTQSIAATVEVGAGGTYKTLLVSPSTIYSPASTGITMFKVDKNGVLRDLHVVVSNLFTGKVMDVEDTITFNDANAFSIDGLSIDAGTYSTNGYGLYLSPPTGSWIQLTNFSNIHIQGLLYPLYINSVGTNTYFNGNNFNNIVLAGNGSLLTLNSTGLQIWGNHFTNLMLDGTGCGISYTGTTNTFFNHFYGYIWDTTTPICNSNTAAIQNVFTGMIDHTYTDPNAAASVYPYQNIYNLPNGVTNFISAPIVGAVSQAATGDAVNWLWQNGSGHQWELISSGLTGTCLQNSWCIRDGTAGRIVLGANSSGLFGIGNNADPASDGFQVTNAGAATASSVQIGAGTAMSANHGTGTSVQHSDGTGASGNLPKFNADGSITDSGIPATAISRTCNANGCYLHYADGTYHMWGASTAVTGTPTAQALTITFPVTLTGTTNLHISATAVSDAAGDANPHPADCHIVRTSLATTGATAVITTPTQVGGSGYTGLATGDYCSWEADGY